MKQKKQNQLTVRVTDEVMNYLTQKSDELGITTNLVINMILTKVVKANGQKENNQ